VSLFDVKGSSSVIRQSWCVAAPGLLRAFFPAPAAASAVRFRAGAAVCRSGAGLFNPPGARGAFCATGPAWPLSASLAFEALAWRRLARTMALKTTARTARVGPKSRHWRGGGLLGGLPGSPAPHLLKSKPLWVCCGARCFAACCFLPMAAWAQRASGCGRAVANRRRGTAATQGPAMARRTRQRRRTGPNPVQRAPRAAAPRALAQRPRCAPGLGLLQTARVFFVLGLAARQGLARV
jgi:hypothetical protein